MHKSDHKAKWSGNKTITRVETHLVVNWPLPWTTGHFTLFWLQASIALQHDRMRFKKASKKSWSINVKAHIWHCNYKETNEKKSSFIILFIFVFLLLPCLSVPLLQFLFLIPQQNQEAKR